MTSDFPRRTDPPVIDVHAHVCPPRVIDTVRADPWSYGVRVVDFESAPPSLVIAGQSSRAVFTEMTDVHGGRRTMMDAQGVSSEVISVWPDLLGYHLDPASGEAWARLLNDEVAADAVRNTHFAGWFATLPLQDVDAALREIHRAKDAGAVGIVLGTNVQGNYLDAPRYDPIWRAAVDLGLPVLLHPIEPAIHRDAARYNLRALVGYVAESTTAVAALILGGVFDRVPKLQVIVVHGGGALPYQIGRLDRGHEILRATGATCDNAPSTYLDALYFDTVLFDTDALRYLLDRVGDGRVLLGSDTPFSVGAPDPLTVLGDLDPATVQRITQDNARGLFPGLSLAETSVSGIEEAAG